MPSSAAAIIQDVGFAAVAAGVPGAAGVLSGNLNIGESTHFLDHCSSHEALKGKSAASAAVRSPVARPPSKTNVQVASSTCNEKTIDMSRVSIDVKFSSRRTSCYSTCFCRRNVIWRMDPSEQLTGFGWSTGGSNAA